MFLRLVLTLSLLLSQAAVAAEVDMLQLLFEERESGVGVYTTRMLMDKRFLRIDSGADSDDYVLFDRVKGEIHNFNHEDRSEIIIQRRPPTALQSALDLTRQSQVLQDAPVVAGTRAHSNFYFSNGELCRSVVSFPGLLPRAVRTLAQYERLIQQQNRQTLDQLPQELRSACNMANNYLAADGYLENGFPVHVVDYNGREKRLIDFGEVSKPIELLRRTPGYRVFYPTLPSP